MTGPKTNEREGTRALLRSAPISAFKVREVLDLIRGEEVGRAAEILQFCERGAAEPVGKVLASAVANAAHNDELDPEELFVAACYADESKTQRRMRPRARGRATRIRKRSAHITIIVSRLPEERLARLRTRRAAEQAARRGRRGRGAAATAGGRRRRLAGGRTREDVATQTHDHDHDHDELVTDLVDGEPEAGAEELGGEDRAEMTDTAVAGDELAADTTTDEGAADDRVADDDDDDEGAGDEVVGDEVADEGEAPEGSAE
jgi:large subunit ribosomal protein L22